MAKSTQPSLLDIDESLLHRNLLINKDEEEFQQLLSAAMAAKGQQEPRLLPHKLVTPKPGFCIKVRNMQTGQKIFVNVCHTDVIPQPEDVTEDQLARILESDEPSTFRVPMSLGEGHKETDKSGGECIAYDVAINSHFLTKVQTSELFLTFLVVAAMEGLEDKYQVELDKNSWTVLKNRKHLGTIQSHRVEQRDEKPMVREVPKPTQIGTELKTNKLLIAEIPPSSVPGEETRRGDRKPYHLSLARCSDGQSFVQAQFCLRNPNLKECKLYIGEQELHFAVKNENLNYSLTFPQNVDAKLARAVYSVSQGIMTLYAPCLV